MFAELYSSKLNKFFDDNDSLSSTRFSDTIAAYQVTGDAWSSASGTEFVPTARTQFVPIVVHHRRSKPDLYRPGHFIPETFGTPRIFALPSNTQIEPALLRNFGHLLITMMQAPGVEQLVAGDENVPEPPPVAKLQILDSYGYRCLRCGYGKLCDGCEPTDEDLPVQSTQPIGYYGSPNTPLGNFRVSILWGNTSLYNKAADVVDRTDNGDPTQVSSNEDAVDLASCLRLFTAEEQLSPEEAWYCRQCKEHRQAYKQMQLHRLPSHLVIQLKRFSFTTNPNGYSAFSDKIESLIEFPLQGLDMSEFCSSSAIFSNDCTDSLGSSFELSGGAVAELPEEDRLYDLYAVSNHSGSCSGGHYFSYVRSLSQSLAQANDTWYCHDDSSVRAMSASSVVTSGAYVLFYVRRSSWKQFAASLQTHLQSNDSNATADVEMAPTSSKTIAELSDDEGIL